MNYKKGDVVRGTEAYRFNQWIWMNIYEVLDVEDRTRFGKPDQLLTVKISTTNGSVVDEKTKRWSNQLF